MNKADEEAIKQLARNVDAAFDAGNATKMASYWADDGLNVSPFGEVFEGRANVEKDLRDSLSGFMKGSKHALAIGRIYSLGESLAVADGIATVSDISGWDGNKMPPLTSDFSMICARSDAGDWRIAQLRAYRFLSKQG